MSRLRRILEGGAAGRLSGSCPFGVRTATQFEGVRSLAPVPPLRRAPRLPESALRNMLVRVGSILLRIQTQNRLRLSQVPHSYTKVPVVVLRLQQLLRWDSIQPKRMCDCSGLKIRGCFQMLRRTTRKIRNFRNFIPRETMALGPSTHELLNLSCGLRALSTPVRQWCPE